LQALLVPHLRMLVETVEIQLLSTVEPHTRPAAAAAGVQIQEQPEPQELQEQQAMEIQTIQAVLVSQGLRLMAAAAAELLVQVESEKPELQMLPVDQRLLMAVPVEMVRQPITVQEPLQATHTAAVEVEAQITALAVPEMLVTF